MIWLLKTPGFKQFIRGLIVFILITSIPATINYFHWKNDIIQQQGRTFSFEGRINDTEIAFSKIVNVPVSTDIVILVNKTINLTNVRIYITLFSEANLDAYLNNRTTPFTQFSFRDIAPDEQSKQITFTTESVDDHYIVFYTEEIPESPFDVIFSYQIFVEPYVLRNGFFVIFLYSMTWIIYYPSSYKLKTYFRRKRLIKETERARELEEVEFYRRMDQKYGKLE